MPAIALATPDELRKHADEIEQVLHLDHMTGYCLFWILEPRVELPKEVNLPAEAFVPFDRQARITNRIGNCSKNGHWVELGLILLEGHGVLLHLSDLGADGLPYAKVGDPGTCLEGVGIGTTLGRSLIAAVLRLRAAQKEQQP